MRRDGEEAEAHARRHASIDARSLLAKAAVSSGSPILILLSASTVSQGVWRVGNRGVPRLYPGRADDEAHGIAEPLVRLWD